MDWTALAFSLLGAGAGRSLMEAGQSRGEPAPAAPSVSDRPLEPAEAAQRFVEFLRDQGLAGTRTWTGRLGILELYQWHCFEDQVAPLPENIIARELGRILDKTQVSDCSSGKRKRLTAYVIEG